MMEQFDDALQRLRAADPLVGPTSSPDTDALLARVTSRPRSTRVQDWRHSTKVRVGAVTTALAAATTATVLSLGASSVAPTLALAPGQTHVASGPTTTVPLGPTKSRGGMASIMIPAANYVLAADATLSRLAPTLPVVSVGTTVSKAQLAALAAATNVPTEQAFWSSSAETSTYVYNMSGGDALSVAMSPYPTFTFQNTTAQCMVYPEHPPLVDFDAQRATTWSDAFLATLGVGPATAGDVENGTAGWMCGPGSFWQFERPYLVNGVATGLFFQFSYLVSDGSLFSASGPLLTTTVGSNDALLSPVDAAQAYINANQRESQPSLPLVAVSLGAPTLQYGLYQVQDVLQFLPTYAFTAACTPASPYCTANSFSQMADSQLKDWTVAPISLPIGAR